MIVSPRARLCECPSSSQCTMSAGILDVALDMDATGCIRGSFRMTAEGIEGEITTDRSTTRQLLADRAEELNEAIAKATGEACHCSFSWNATVEANGIYEEANPGFEVTKEQREVQTSKLYGLARSFIDILGSLRG
ncbi:MAG: hypothetical protein II051_01240 [Lachnospiraceae bacterium]|nr:hypothetical protein [Lachnospiraceae bacterium]